MEIKKNWFFTSAGGTKWVVYQSKRTGNFYKEFKAKNYKEALAIANQIIQNFEQQTPKN